MQTSGIATLGMADVAFFMPPGRPQRPGRRNAERRGPSILDRVRRARANATRRISRARHRA